MSGYRELVEKTRSRVTEVTPAEVAGRLEQITVIDVREVSEYEQGAIPGARFLPRGILERDVAGVIADPDTPLILYCEGGHRSILGAAALQDMGYTDVASMSGGFNRWKNDGHPWGDPGGLTTEQRTRYARHVRLPEVGEAGQLQLLGARVLLIGAGGLGSPAALYLAAAGVGTIGVVDDDVVDSTNLQRQIIHNVDRIGMNKVDSARESLLALNPDVKVETHRDRLNASNALAVMSDYDVIVDGGDNFPTRYLINDASMHLKVPVVHGSIFRFEGQVTVLEPYEGPCYRCLYPLPPPPELAPSCAEAGVLGVLPGVIGSIQAMEALKLVLDIGDTLTGRLMVYDALEQDFMTVTVMRNPECPACSDPDRPPTLADYDETCRPAV
jgi:molybdopterin/thiamine biosynthesis adenylyltransferase/rhodanese-related sulfurtransferase